MKRRDLLKGFIPVVAGGALASTNASSKDALFKGDLIKEFPIQNNVLCPKCGYSMPYFHKDPESAYTLSCYNQHCSEYLIKYKSPTVVLEIA